MNFEQYTLILRHDMICGEEKIKIDQPIIMSLIVDRRYEPNSEIILNRMMDNFKDSILRRIDIGEIT